MSGAGWIASSYVTTLWGLYATYGLLCGIGTGIVYIGIIGLMVKWFPGPARVGDRRGGGRLRLRRHPHDLPDRRHAEGVRLSAHAVRLRRDLRRRRRDRRADAAGAARGRSRRRRPTLMQRGAQRDPGGDAENAGVLADVRDDVDDVDRRPDGDHPVHELRQGVRHRRAAPGHDPGRDAGGDPGGADLRSRHQRAHAPVLRLGVRSHRPREHDGRSPSSWKASRST